MSLTYEEVAANLFGRDEFTVREFEARTGSDRGGKILHEFKERGVADRTGRGRYRMLGPEERPDRRSEEWARVRETVLEAPFGKAWTGPTAVEVWTRGRYRVASSPFRRVFHVAVHEEDLEEWKRYLRARNVATEGRKSIGAFVNLEPRDGPLPSEEIDGEPVIGREEALALVREHPGIYGEAEGLMV